MTRMPAFKVFNRKYLLTVCTALVTGLILALAQIKIQPPILLFERFIPGTGWIAVFTAAAYAAMVTKGMHIENTCTICMACSVKCKYDALNLQDIQAGKPAITCIYCGDCVSACHLDSIKYRFLGLQAEKARNLYLVLTISLHASFIFLARI